MLFPADECDFLGQRCAPGMRIRRASPAAGRILQDFVGDGERHQRGRRSASRKGVDRVIESKCSRLHRNSPRVVLFGLTIGVRFAEKWPRSRSKVRFEGECP